MVEHELVLADNDLMLSWHRGATTIPMEAFQPWALAMLKAALQFDGASWALTANHGEIDAESEKIGISSSDVVHRFGRLRLDVPTAADVWLHGPDGAAVRRDSPPLEMGDAMCVSGLHIESGRQVLALAREASAPRFTTQEQSRFALLAPHLMQAYAACRQWFLVELREARDTRAPWSVAIAGRRGELHDHDSRFIAMLRREWADWPGQCLPEALLAPDPRRGHPRRSFLGEQIAADLSPLHDFVLVTVRPRMARDLLTARERHVAERYAAGMNYKQIAEKMKLAPATVRSHLRKVFAKLKVSNKTQLTAILR